VTARGDHWQRIYGTKKPDEVSWYAAHLEPSLASIRAVATTDAPILDVGGGASTLVDDLLADGYRNVSVLDISTTALEAAKVRLGVAAPRVTWIAGDVTGVALPDDAYDVWHDRAVFHFLTDAADRRAYRNRLERSLRAGGHAIIATFAPDGPPRCSGLDVVRYDGEGLGNELGPAFVLEEQTRLVHRTPAGVDQRFSHCRFRNRG
jgi:SAM-dependent methyltransferase